MTQPQAGILEQIRSSYDRMTATEHLVADYVLSHSTDVQFMSITQLAEECGAAEATISRFCRNMGLKGFNAFKLELAKDTVGMASRSRDDGDPSTFKGRCRISGDLICDAVTQTLGLIRQDTVEAVAGLFEKARYVVCLGSGGSMILAQECAHLFSTVTHKFWSIGDTHQQLSTVASLDSRDVVVLFSYSGATRSGLEILELARSQGVATVLITRHRKSPAANVAGHVLLCGANEAPFQGGSSAAKIAQLTLVDVLYREYCHRNQAECEENVRQISAAVSVEHI